jgi:hypothetical protein
MSNKNLSWSRVSVIRVALGLLAPFGVLAIGQDAPAVHVGPARIAGLPYDWTHDHVVFSNPGTEQEAISAGRHEEWQKVVNNPRYVMQQLRKNLPVQGPAAVDAAYRAKWISEARGSSGTDIEALEDVEPPSGFEEWTPGQREPRKKRIHVPSNIKRDWSMPLGGPGLAAGQYPAKYSFSTTSANCSDYIAFPTGAGGTATQSTIVAFNNIYVGASGNACAATLPTVYWAFNTPPGGIAADSATANLSPVLSYDGTQVAFVETYSGTGYLVILKMASEPSSAYNSPSSSLTYRTLATYKGCTAPCYTTISLGAADTSSAPFYVYGSTNSDTLYVGDDSGKVHEVTGVFSGTPSLDTAAGWPTTASTETSHALNSPIYDAMSGNIFVGDSGGYLHEFAVSTPASVSTSGRLENNTVGIFDPPIIDSTTELVYAFIGYSGDTGNNNPSYINRYPAGSAITTGSFGTGLPFGNGSATHTNNPATSIMRAGGFDYQYALSSGTSGHFYSCVNGHVYQITITTTTTMAVAAFNAPVSALATCSPVTESLGVKLSTTLSTAIGTIGAVTVTVASTTGMTVGDYIQIDSEIMLVNTVPTGATFTVAAGGRGQDGTAAATHNTTGVAVQDVQDWLFMSVAASGNAAGCTAACVYNYNVISGAAAATPTAGLPEPGGTSGFVIDSMSTSQTGAEQVYFSTLTGNTAVQASQSALQ